MAGGPTFTSAPRALSRTVSCGSVILSISTFTHASTVGSDFDPGPFLSSPCLSSPLPGNPFPNGGCPLPNGGWAPASVVTRAPTPATPATSTSGARTFESHTIVILRSVEEGPGNLLPDRLRRLP